MITLDSIEEKVLDEKGHVAKKLIFPDIMREHYNDDPIYFNKKYTQAKRSIENNVKLSYCYICHEDKESLCNSHHIPRFCLKNIASNGNLINCGFMYDFPIDISSDKPIKGINNSGTFHLICNRCDSSLFQDYENPNNYDIKPTNKIMSEIAMKNALKFIYKRLHESYTYDLIDDDTRGRITNQDLIEYEKDFQYAKKAYDKSDKWDDYFYLGWYKRLNYVVPIAFQGAVCVPIDLEGNTINDVYEEGEKYRVQDLQVCIFPLVDSTVVFLFNRTKHRHYSGFYKQLKKLDTSDALSAINFLVFAYTEDYFISPEMKSVVEDFNLKDVGVSGMEHILDAVKFKNSYERPNFTKLQSESCNFSLRDTIPNLLSEEYKLR